MILLIVANVDGKQKTEIIKVIKWIARKGLLLTSLLSKYNNYNDVSKISHISIWHKIPDYEGSASKFLINIKNKLYSLL